MAKSFKSKAEDVEEPAQDPETPFSLRVDGGLVARFTSKVFAEQVAKKYFGDAAEITDDTPPDE